MRKTLALILTLLVFHSKAQFCDRLTLMVSTASNVDFTFDSFGKYIGGITQNSASQLKLTVENNVLNSPDCRWNLVMYVDNGNNPINPGDEWEELTSYTQAGNGPKIDALQVRIRNRCSTSMTGTGFFPYTLLPGIPLYIIENNGITVPAGSCAGNVNGPGNYLTNYDEFTFDVDYRLVPGLGLKSGIYQLRVQFVLIEDL